jgi:hypothetical protein
MNNNPAWQSVLQNILVRENRSLFQFVGEAFPWARSDEMVTLARLRQMIEEEQKAAIALTAFLRRQHIPLPYLGPYPSSYLSLLFVALDYLLPQLIEHHRQVIGQLENDLELIPQPEARKPVEALLALKRRNLRELEELAIRRPKAVHA